MNSFASVCVAFVMSLSMKPDAMTFTVMCRDAYSRAMHLAAPMRAALVAV